MDKTALKIIEALRLAESNNPELALSSLRLACRLAGGSLASWLESITAADVRTREPRPIESELATLKDEIEWLGRMLRARNEEVRTLKKAMDNVHGKTIAPEQLELQRVQAELHDAKQALRLLTGFVDDLIKGVHQSRADFEGHGDRSEGPVRS